MRFEIFLSENAEQKFLVFNISPKLPLIFDEHFREKNQ